MPDKRLKSNDDTRPLRNPGEGAPEKGHSERAESRIWTGGYLQYRERGLGLAGIIRSGADTYRLEELARHREPAIALNAVEAAAFWAPGEIQATNDYERYPSFEKIDNKIIAAINKILSNFGYETFENSLKAMLRNAVTCGYCVAEPAWEKTRGGKWVLRAIKVKKPWDFNPVVDAFDNLTEIFHYPTGKYFEPDAFIYGVWPYLRNGNYFGLSMLEPVYWDIIALRKLEEWRIKGVRQVLVKPALHYFDAATQSIDQQNAAKNSFDDMESADIVHLPSMMNPDTNEIIKSSVLEMTEDRASGGGFEDINDIIKEKAAGIKRALGMPDDLGSTTVSVGSRAKAETEYNVFAAVAYQAQQWIKDIVDHNIIQPMLKWTFPSLPPMYSAPEWVQQELEEEYTLDQVNFIATAIQTGVLNMNDPADVNLARERLGFPPSDGVAGVANDAARPSAGLDA